MLRSRAFLVAVIGTFAIAGLLGAWFVSGWGDTKARADAIEKAPIRQAKEQARTLASELSRELDSIRMSEDARPYYHYQNLFNDPRGASVGLSVNPSPLVAKTADPLVAVHYQIDAKGALTIPPINDDVPELSEQSALAGNLFVLSELRGAKSELGLDSVGEATAVATATKRRRTRRVQPTQPAPPQQVQQLDPASFAQNTNANAVFLEVQGQEAVPQKHEKQTAQTGKTAPTRTQPPGQRFKKEPAPPVEIRIAGFRWDTAIIGDGPRLVATRTVETPAGILAQGFVIDQKAVAQWLDERSGGAARLISADEDATDTAARLEGIAGAAGWAILVDLDSEVSSAHRAAAEVRARFWWWFVACGAFGLFGLALIVWVVRRAEALARERSQFAAAAAHELRTPLAGLQLYGEMLADGLGEPGQAAKYAQRVSEEAARLGRVVGNVLGFTQLEHGALAVDAKPGDVSAATQEAVELSRRSLEAAGVELVVDIPERVHARFDGDAHKRIIGNLLDNAEKYSRSSSERRVRVRLIEGEDTISIAIADNGRGVDEARRETIFRPFARDAGDEGAAGLGLGLALARTLARDQGGDLTCEPSSPEGGACFLLRLPRV